MDEFSWGTYLLPWWKPLAYLGGLTAIGATIRLSLTFNFNEYLKEREARKAQKERMRDVKSCAHIWTLYPSSEFSQCNLCMAIIKTSTLLFANEHVDPKPVIIATRVGININPGGSAIQVSSYIGNR